MVHTGDTKTPSGTCFGTRLVKSGYCKRACLSSRVKIAVEYFCACADSCCFLPVSQQTRPPECIQCTLNLSVLNRKKVRTSILRVAAWNWVLSAETILIAGKAWVLVRMDALYQIGVFYFHAPFFCLVHVSSLLSTILGS